MAALAVRCQSMERQQGHRSMVMLLLQEDRPPDLEPERRWRNLARAFRLPVAKSGRALGCQMAQPLVLSWAKAQAGTLKASAKVVRWSP